MRSILILLSIALVLEAGSIYSKKKDFFDSVERETSRERGDEPDGDIWALLVAGSNGWYNYRHQADVAHAYHLLIRHGVPAENIITMAFDDIANNRQNPYKGKIYNSPSFVDVYKGLVIDYTGESVNSHNFLNILKGNATGVKGGNGKVLESGPEDRVFVYFTDHGATGLISFPEDILTTKELNDALIWASENEKFNDLVFYLEACESGSMFEKVLPDNINVYAISAANGHESSWGTYCENPRNLPCLGDLFSVSWMEDSDEEDLEKETVGQQYELVKKETNKSHVCKFGKMATESDPVGWFQGLEQEKSRNRYHKKHLSDRSQSVPSRDVELKHLERRMMMTNDGDEVKEIQNRIETIHLKRREMKHIVKALTLRIFNDPMKTVAEKTAHRQLVFSTRVHVEYPACHHKVVHAFHKLCVHPKSEMEYAMQYMNVLNNFCYQTFGNTDPIIGAIIDVCLDSKKLP